MFRVPTFRVAPNQSAQQSTAPIFVLCTITLFNNYHLPLNFVLADMTTPQQYDAITSLLSLSIAAADDDALSIPALSKHTPSSGVA
jgi:hypothetical protein